MRISGYVTEERTPLMKPEWDATFRLMREHPDAPVRNAECGDRLGAADLERIVAFRETLSGERRAGGEPPAAIFEWVELLRRRSDHAAAALAGLSLPRDWARVPPMTRLDLRDRIEAVIPRDESLDRLIVNPTSGTTGEPVRVPSHPYAQGCYDPLIERALGLHGVATVRGPGRVQAVQVCSQKWTIVYDTVHSYYDGAGFAKVNLDPSGWRSPGAAARWLPDMAPVFLSGDPVAWSALLDANIRVRPLALLSTAATLQPGLRQALAAAFGCPVVDVYSSNDSGPVACSDPVSPVHPSGGTLMRILPRDLFLEITDADGNQVPDGRPGDILLTGGRNPFVPLLRYRTGDRGLLVRDENGPGLVLLEGRNAISVRLPSGAILNPVDIARVLRAFPVRRHRVLARRDGSFELRVDCPGWRFVREAALAALADVFENAPLDVVQGFEGVPAKAAPFELE
ncbi:MAG: hypothetical protein NT080_00075 [Spirochaetes bacterium]|nr:hypothetical protein [Spirochaetota bacterium]